MQTIEFKRSPVDWKFDASQFIPVIEFDEEPLERPRKALRLATQELKKIGPAWSLVEETLRIVEKNRHLFDYNNFCILDFIVPPMSFIQTVHSRPGGRDFSPNWRLEWRDCHPDGGYTHYFAQMKSGPEGSKTIPHFQVVIDAFRAFYYNKPWPDDLEWLVYDI